MHLVALCRIEMRSMPVGAYLLQKGDTLQFVFGFECAGIHPTLKPEQLAPLFEALEAGLKDLPPQEKITFHLGSFADDRSRQRELKSAIESAASDDTAFLLLGERARLQELTRLGVRKTKFLRLWVTHTLQSGERGSDWIEKLIARGLDFWVRFKGEAQQARLRALDELLVRAYTQGFSPWNQLLANKMALPVRPMGEEELWSALYARFSEREAPPIPQRLLYSDRVSQPVSEQITSEQSPSTVLLHSGVPVADRRWVHVRGNYVGVLSFAAKPAGWSSPAAQVRYLWEVIARQDVADTEVFCELTPANPKLVQTAIQRVGKQSNVQAQTAEQKSSFDVAARIKTKRSEQAAERLYEGDRPVYTAVVFLVHRPNLEALDDACERLTSYVRSPARLYREEEIAWRVWRQTLPVNLEGLLAVPFPQRRLLYLTSEVPGLLPLVCTKTGDRSGFELIAEEGGTPVLIDIVGRHRNLGVFGTTRSGKSVLISGLLTRALAADLPVVALDYPKPDGSSTFSDYTRFFGEDGAYFDIGKQKNNLFEQPDLSSLAPDERQVSFAEWQSFLESALMTMVLGRDDGRGDRLLTQTIRSLLTIALAQFFRTPEIARRYALAREAGFGTTAWQETPTLRDFLAFCSEEHLKLENLEGDLERALGMIRLRIRFWLESRVGQAICAPSSFRTDARLLVFALTNLSNPEDAAVLALSAYSGALRRALSRPASVFFLDEAPILFEFDEISALVAKLCANGAKAGVRVILSAQDPDTIARSPSASKIIQNLTTRLVGRIQPNAVDSFVNILKYPRQIVARNASEAFFPVADQIYSQWLVDENDTFTFCRYYPGYVQLAAVANNPDEARARTECLRSHPDKYEGMAAFAQTLVQAIREGKKL